jgi:hypothetical protein
MYKAEATAQGFETFLQEQVPVQFANTTTVDIALQLGSVKQTVTVTAAAPILNTVSASVGTVVSSGLIENLPTPARNPLALVYLSPGVNYSVGANQGGDQSSYTAGSNSPLGMGEALVSTAVANGGDPYGNSFTLDNAANNRVEEINFCPNTDQLEEISVLAASYDAQQQNGGMALVMVTKGGTSKLHGNAFEYDENKDFDANSFFNNYYGYPKNTIHYNQFGGSIGGPIYIPHVYTGKNLFFFGNYEGVRMPTSGTATYSLPTDAQRAGDFSQTLAANGNLIQIYNPFTTRPDPSNPGNYIRDPFTGNVVPPSLINATAKTLYSRLPEPNQPGMQYTNANNYHIGYGRDIPTNFYNARVDWNLGANDRLYTRFSHEKFLAEPVHTLNMGEGRWMDYGSDNPVAGWTHTFNPTTVMEVSAGYARHFNDFGDDPYDLAGIGFAQNFASAVSYLPYMSVSGLSTFGNAVPYWVHGDDASLNVNFRHMQGRHSLKWGYEQTLTHFNNGNYGVDTSFSFDSLYTQGPNPLATGENIGYGAAAFMLGLDTPTNGDSAGGPYGVTPSSASYGLYVQDDIRVTPKLTINAGLRWDVFQVSKERHNDQTVGFAFNTPNPLEAQAQANYAAEDSMMFSILPPDQFKVLGGLIYATPQHTRWAATRYNQFSPRIGFAYRLTNKTVMRGGFGMYKNTWYGGLNQNDGYQIYQPILSSLDGVTPNPAVRFNNPTPDGFITPTGNSLGLLTEIGTDISPNNQNAQAYAYSRWSLGFQRELTPTTTAEVNYVGSSSFHLPYVGEASGEPPWSFPSPGISDHKRELNFVKPQYLNSLGSQLFTEVPNPFYGLTGVPAGTILSGPTVNMGQLLATYPEFGSTILRFDTSGRSYYHSLQITVTRRMSQGLTLLGAYTFSKELDRWQFVNPSDSGPTKSVGEYDAPEKLTVGLVYLLPFGPSQRFVSRGGPLGKVVGGWEYSVNQIFQSGQPALVRDNDVWTGISPKLTSGRSYLNWFNTAAFTPEPELQPRTCPWFIPGFRYDHINNWDMALIKNTKLNERASLQFRWESWNTFNRFMVGTPDTNPTSSTYGQAWSQGNLPRNMKFSLELKF